MSTQRIEFPGRLAKAEQPIDAPATLLLKIAAGTLILLLSAILILPYVIVLSVYMVAAAGLHQVKVAATAIYETVVFAGGVVIGR